MSLRWRLNLFFLIAALLTAITGAAALVSTSRLESAMEEIGQTHEHELLVEECVTQMSIMEAEHLHYLESVLQRRRLGEQLRDAQEVARSGVPGGALVPLVSAIERFQLPGQREDLKQSVKARGERVATLLGGIPASLNGDDLKEAFSEFDALINRLKFLMEKGHEFEKTRQELDRVGTKIQQRKERLRQNLRMIATAARDRANNISTVLTIVVGICFVSLLALAAIGLFLLRAWLVTPIEQLVGATRHVAQGDFTKVGPVERTDEFGELAREFDDMSRSLTRYQSQLVEKERLAAVGEMTAAVAHNVRNPLASIRALSQGLLRCDNPHERLEQDLKTVMVTVDRASRWLKDLLVAQRPVTVERMPEDLTEILKELVALQQDFADRRGVTLNLELDPDLPLVALDRRRLDQALLSVLSNAIEAAPPGGFVRVATRQREARLVEIVVEDNGPGMDEKTRGKIFLPYFSTKKNGTGMGLNLTQRIVFSHQGSIAVESNPGAGCRMIVKLPLAPLKSDESEESTAAPAVNGQSPLDNASPKGLDTP